MGLVTIGVFMGVVGTLSMDLWAMVLHRFFGQPLPNWGNVGRWATEVSRGRVFHSDICEVPPVFGETHIGWAVHYGVGILYGILFLMIVGSQWLVGKPFIPLWIFALVTIAAGWFLLLPGMGLGWAASRTDNPWRVRGMGLAAHTVFAAGMWVAALVTTL